jgi:hypothetical protein
LPARLLDVEEPTGAAATFFRQARAFAGELLPEVPIPWLAGGPGAIMTAIPPRGRAIQNSSAPREAANLNRSDWNLVALSAAMGQPLSPAQLQKVLFLLQRSFPDAVQGGYAFRPYNYGPFDAEVYCDAERMQLEGLVHVRRTSGGWKEFSATPAGLERASVLAERADPRAVEYLRRVVAWAKRLSFAELVRAVYSAYPEMMANSIFKDNQ